MLQAALTPGGFDEQAPDPDELRISIAGAQEKTALLWHQGHWWRPAGATPSTHILKLPLGLAGNMKLDLRDSVESEWLCAQILQAHGLPVARCHPLSFEGQRVLGIERFDRRWADDGSWLIRLPQEDMCQATATPAHAKYEADGGPGIDRIFEVLNGSTRREQDRANFFRAQLLFWLMCAPHGHAKNFSIALHAGGAFSMTPLYDVVSAYPVLGSGPNRISPHRVKHSTRWWPSYPAASRRMLPTRSSAVSRLQSGSSSRQPRGSDSTSAACRKAHPPGAPGRAGSRPGPRR